MAASCVTVVLLACANSFAAQYYVDYSAGADSNPGTSRLAAWQHCPGDPVAAGNPAATALKPGDTVYFKGGVSYVFRAPKVYVSNPGIGLNWSGAAGQPIAYDGNSAGDWGTGRAIFTDNHGTNLIVAFYANGSVSNLVFNSLEIGPIAGASSLTLPSVPSSNESKRNSPANRKLGVWLLPPPVTSVGSTIHWPIQIYNRTSKDVNDISFSFGGGPWKVASPLPTNAPAGSDFLVYADFTPTAIGLYSNSMVVTALGGIAITGDVVGAASVVGNPGWGISVRGSMNDVTVTNCYFHEIGHWSNQAPLSAGIVDGIGLVCQGGSNLTIANCEFTRMQIGIDIVYGSVSNLAIANCRFHDYIVWCLDMAGLAGGTMDYVQIHDNQFYDFDWAYAPSYWSGYGGSPHQDGIFHRRMDVSTRIGPNVNIYNNTFYDTHTGGIATACIYLSGNPSANIYNNLFNLSISGTRPIEIANDTDGPSLTRIMNNTILCDTASQAGSPAFHIGGAWYTVPPHTWATNSPLLIANNISYSFLTKGGSTLMLIGTVTNQVAAPCWVMDYNDYRISSKVDYWFWINNSVGYTANGGLGVARSFGYELHSQTNDPKFVSLAYGSSVNSVSNDYHLQAGSAAIGAGTNLSNLKLPGLNADRDGNPRPLTGPWDLGAYQYMRPKGTSLNVQNGLPSSR